MQKKISVSLVFFFMLFALGSSADLLTKHWAFQSLGLPGEYHSEQPELQATHWLWKDVIGFQTALNPGALFGFGQGKVFYLATLSFIFLAGILIGVICYAWKNYFMTVIFALISAGIFGNLYDRLALHGITTRDGEPVYAVRDWILVMLGTYHWPNFNIADSLLVCSVILLMIYSIWFDKPTSASANADLEPENSSSRTPEASKTSNTEV